MKAERSGGQDLQVWRSCSPEAAFQGRGAPGGGGGGQHPDASVRHSGPSRAIHIAAQFYHFLGVCLAQWKHPGTPLTGTWGDLNPRHCPSWCPAGAPPLPG